MVRSSFSWNSLRMLCAIAMLGVLPGPASAQTAPAGAPPTSPSQGSFLVFPFENTGGGPRLDWLSEGLEELTIERLSAAGKPAFAHEARTSELERYGLPSSAKFSRATMLHVAGELDADFVIFGSSTFDGNILSVQAHLLRVSPAALFPPVRETGLLETLMDLHTRVVWRLFSTNDRNFAMSLADFSRAQRPLRLDAFEHFVRGRLATQEEARSRELREAVRLEPEWPEPAYALGQVAFTKRDCATAITWFARIPPAHERYTQAMFSTGVCRLWMNEPDRAETTFSALQESLRRVAAEAGDLPEVLNNLAIARSRLGKLEPAQEDLRRAAELDVTALPQEVEFAQRRSNGSPSSPASMPGPEHVRRGRLELSAGHLADAEREFRAALAADARDASAHRGLADVLRRQGKLDEAVAELRTSIATRDSAGTRTALARLYIDQKKPDLARQELEHALQLAPNYAGAKQLLQRLPAAKQGATKP